MQPASSSPTANETSGITTRAIVRYVRAAGGDEAVLETLERSGVQRSLQHLENESSWSTYDEKVALFAAAAEVLDDPEVARHIGATVLRLRIGLGLVVLLRALGSPEQVLRNISATAAKFSSVCTMRTLAASSDGARVTYRLHEGHQPSAHDCGYNVGLLSQVSEVFGLPPASVTHSHCQVAGASECVYDLRWPRHSRLPWARRQSRLDYLSDQVGRLRERTDDLQATIAELVSTDDVDRLLEKIAARAGAAVQAPQHLLVVWLGSSLLVHHSGLGEKQAHRLAECVIRGDEMPPEGTYLVAEVASSRHRHGKLLAIFPAVATFFPEEQQLLDSYARQAAAALDAAIALEEARTREETATSLLELSRALTLTSTEDELARVVATLIPRVMGDGTGWFARIDKQTMELVVTAAGGIPEEERRDDELPYRIAADESTVLAALARAGKPGVITRDQVDTFLRGVLDELRAELLLAAPVTVGGEPVAFVFSTVGDQPLERASERWLERLEGVADQTALALERVRLLDRTRALADEDALTGLPNTRLFQRFAQQAFALARRREKQAALMFVDLDNFKRVNDTLGHGTGNDLLQRVAGMLRQALRTSDAVARMGGDEFAILLPDVAGVGDAERVAQKLLRTFARPLAVEGHRVVVSPSIGIALYPAHGTNVDEVLQAADSAMYRAKELGRNTYQLYAPALARPGGDLLEFEELLRDAIQKQKLRLVYQPIFNVETGALSGVEALVRWRDPKLGDVSATQIVESAEQTGQILQLGRWVLRTACAQHLKWRRAGLDAPRLHVNVSASEFRKPHLLDSVRDAIDRYDIQPGHLVLEVTESAAVRDPEDAAELSEALRAMGVGLALDDFGTGYSMLGRLQHLRFEQLKLERTFIARIGDDESAHQITTALIALGHALRLQVVAEGIETTEQLGFLRDHGCEYAQGDLLGRPQPPDAIAPLAAGAAAPK